MPLSVILTEKPYAMQAKNNHSEVFKAVRPIVKGVLFPVDATGLGN